jgi:hypothetical protein
MRNEKMTHTSTVLILMLTAMMSGGCLQQEKQHRFYLELDGAVTWTIIEHDIHAVSGTPDSRQREEEEFLGLVRTERHPAAAGLAALGASGVRVQVVRSEWPYMVVTEARFPSLGQLWQDMLRTAGLTGGSTLERQGDKMIWTLVVFEDETARPPDENSARAVNELLDPGKDIQFFIRQGQFVEAQGFDVSDDNRVATLKESVLEGSENGKAPVTLCLKWTPLERPVER